jgi:hypothetical protein
MSEAGLDLDIQTRGSSGHKHAHGFLPRACSAGQPVGTVASSRDFSRPTQDYSYISALSSMLVDKLENIDIITSILV